MQSDLTGREAGPSASGTALIVDIPEVQGRTSLET
jgi:hypothetical protein